MLRNMMTITTTWLSGGYFDDPEKSHHDDGKASKRVQRVRVDVGRVPPWLRQALHTET
jgi:hypothetical protein